MTKKLFFIVVSFFLLLGAPQVVAEDEPLPSSDIQSGSFMFDLRSITHEDIKEEKLITGGINFIFNRAVTIMAATIGAAAVLMITVGGFMMLSSGGQQEWVDKGKAYIKKSLIGLAVALGAYIFVQTVQLLIKSIYA